MESWRGTALRWACINTVPVIARLFLNTSAVVVVPSLVKLRPSLHAACPCSLFSTHPLYVGHAPRTASCLSLLSRAPQAACAAHMLANNEAKGTGRSIDVLVRDRAGEQECLLLLDGFTILYRAYYKLLAKAGYSGVKDMGSEEECVRTVFTSLLTILSLLKVKPTHLAAVFDYGLTFRHTLYDGYNSDYKGLTFRHTLYEGYKSGRPLTPETVVQAHERLRPLLRAMGITVIEVPGVEADDVIATIALKATAAGMKVRIASPDKDFFQILSPPLRLLRLAPRGSEIVSFGVEEFGERFGNLQPSQFVDVLALVGDTADSVPGVLGIGEKTAIKLIQQFGSLESLLEKRETVTLKRARTSLLLDTGGALLSKRLITLRVDVPDFMIPYTLSSLACRTPEDGGDQFIKLLEALGSYGDASISLVLQGRTMELWRIWSMSYSVTP